MKDAEGRSDPEESHWILNPSEETEEALEEWHSEDVLKS